MRFALALLSLALLAQAAEPLRIETTLVDADAISFGTFHSNNQKVVQNRRVIFMTHIRTRNEKYTAQQWRLPLEKNDLAANADPNLVAARARLQQALNGLPADAELGFEFRSSSAFNAKAGKGRTAPKTKGAPKPE